MTPAELDRLCQEALARGVDPAELERAKRAALAECGGDMAKLARELNLRQQLDEFAEAVAALQRRMVQPLSAAPYRRILSEEDRQDLLRGVVQAYPKEIRQLLDEIHPPASS